ncbi:thrombospondin type 3 repeat family protein [Vibrio orientalis CIP 102891 = ATCC 33934]|uniref:Thrombospondin type 3 repeat family protein n=1 Tax=Vibrio orientalis CIP 102891 = ATCC 33934 TaxID=675816 RepID=C9QL21_VIBOR|nr:hypothetical protein [Vibrio orientalis]EEX91501.1 thrombospondin type 3 repeat family protein/Calx-beta domain protein [Vibrio orientalis CIP 102891 = ATCC 33934]EGU47401.1 thrombospondin type 3 repeat family protein [Vibrio orientalis CIP 102891 = ATCC 33934]
MSAKKISKGDFKLRRLHKLPIALVLGGMLVGCNESEHRLLANDDFGVVPENQTRDSDGDGLPDFLEIRMGLDPNNVDSDGDGIPDGEEDNDGDGVINRAEYELGLDPLSQRSDGRFHDLTLDRDNDGIPDYFEWKAELNYLNKQTITGTPDHLVDRDEDGIPDYIEAIAGVEDDTGQTYSLEGHKGVDHNGNNIPDYMEVDSDGDGVPDAIEIELGLDPFDPETVDGTPDADRLKLDSDGDGIPDFIEIQAGLDPELPMTDGSTDDRLLDRDGNNIPDYMEVDSDGDGVADYIEVQIGSDPFDPETIDGTPDLKFDGNDNGLADIAEIDTDGEGIPDYIEDDVGLNPSTPTTDGVTDDKLVDADENGVPDYMEVDSDGDGVPDYAELDTDGDGVLDFLELGTGLDPFDPETIDGTPDLHADLNGNGIPDYAELDTDGDGIPDYLEIEVGLHPGRIQTDGATDDTLFDGDGNNVPDYMEVDSDGDGVEDYIELEFGTNPFDPETVDGTPDSSIDSDGDGVPDVVGFDSDGDGIPDYIEIQAGLNPALAQTDGVTNDMLVDADGDGILDYLEVDTDGDGVPDIDEINNDGDPFVAQPKATLSNLQLLEKDLAEKDLNYKQFEPLAIQYEVDTYGATFVRVDYVVAPVLNHGTTINSDDGSITSTGDFVIDSAGKYEVTLTPYYSYSGVVLPGEPETLQIGIESVRNWLRAFSGNLYSFKSPESTAAIDTTDTYIMYSNGGSSEEDAIFLDENGKLTRAYYKFYYQTSDRDSIANISSQVSDANTPTLTEESKVTNYVSQGTEFGSEVDAHTNAVFYDGETIVRTRQRASEVRSTALFFSSLMQMGGDADHSNYVADLTGNNGQYGKTFDGSLYYAAKGGRMKAYTNVVDMLGDNDNEYTIASYPYSGYETDKYVVEWDSSKRMLGTPKVKGSPSKDLGLAFEVSSKFFDAQTAGSAHYNWSKMVKVDGQYEPESVVVASTVIESDGDGGLFLPDFTPETEGVYRLEITPTNSLDVEGYSVYLQVVVDNSTALDGVKNVYRSMRVGAVGDTSTLLRAFMAVKDGNDFTRFADDGDFSNVTDGRNVYPSYPYADATTIFFDGDYIWADSGDRELFAYDSIQDLALKKASQGVASVPITYKWQVPEDMNVVSGSGVIFSDQNVIYKLDNLTNGNGVTRPDIAFTSQNHGVFEVYPDVQALGSGVSPSITYSVTNSKMDLMTAVTFANGFFYLFTPEGAYRYSSIMDLASDSNGSLLTNTETRFNRKPFFFHNVAG